MRISNLIVFLVVLVSMVAKAIEIESHGHFLLDNYDTSDAKEIWPDDRWWMSCFFVDLNQDGFEEVITTTISQADRYGCAWYFWTTKPDGKLHPVREDYLREKGFVFTCYYYSYYRLIYRDGRDQLIGLDLDAGFLNAGNNKVQSSTSDWLFGISTNNQLSVAKVSPSLDDVFFSNSSVCLRRMYPESYKGFRFDFVPQNAWFGGYEFPKPIASVEPPEKFRAFLSSFQKEAQIRSGVTNDVSVFAVLLDANNDGYTDCYLSSSVDGASKDVYRWTLYVNEKGVLEKAGGKVKSVPHRDDLPSLEPNVKARKDAFCRVVRFDAPPTYIVLDESKVARGLVKKTITDRLTHSIEKLPVAEVPVFAEPTAKTTILSHVKANAREVIVRMNGSHKKEIQQVCDQIDAVDDAVERHALFEELVDEVLAVDLSDLAAQHPEEPLDAMASERQLARAHSALQYVVEQVWQRLMLRSEPPERQLNPWMKLIVKMKSEDERLQTGGRCQEDAIEFVERWFGKYVKACSFQSREALNAFEQRFSDVVGRPIHQ